MQRAQKYPLHSGKPTWKLETGPPKRTVVCEGHTIRFHASFLQCPSLESGAVVRCISTKAALWGVEAGFKLLRLLS